MTASQDVGLAQYVLDVTWALKEGRLKVRDEDASVVAELMAAPVSQFGS